MLTHGLFTSEANRGAVSHVVKTYALFSGGNDSLASTHYAMAHGAQEVLHIHTGIGVPETRSFVHETCRAMGWPLREEYPPDWSYRDMVLRHGFPGPGGHRFAYSWLKERAVRKVVRESKRPGPGHHMDCIRLVTGVRRQESVRRMGFVRPEMRVGSQVWSAPLFDYSILEVMDYLHRYGLTSNPVVKVLGMSGECLCGAFAKPNEIATIERHFPHVARAIHLLEMEVGAAGQHCVWGTRPPREKSLDQYDIPFLPLCAGCPR